MSHLQKTQQTTRCEDLYASTVWDIYIYMSSMEEQHNSSSHTAHKIDVSKQLHLQGWLQLKSMMCCLRLACAACVASVPEFLICSFRKYMSLMQVCYYKPIPYINKIQQDATVCRYLFTAKSLYMFRVSIAPIIRST